MRPSARTCRAALVPAAGNAGWRTSSSTRLGRAIEPLPELERLRVNFEVQLGDARLQALLHIGDRLVVDQWADLLEKIAEQSAGGHVADLLLHVLPEVALDRGDRLG